MGSEVLELHSRVQREVRIFDTIRKVRFELEGVLKWERGTRGGGEDIEVQEAVDPDIHDNSDLVDIGEVGLVNETGDMREVKERDEFGHVNILGCC